MGQDGSSQPVLCLTLSSSMWGVVCMRGPPDPEGTTCWMAWSPRSPCPVLEAHHVLVPGAR